MSFGNSIEEALLRDVNHVAHRDRSTGAFAVVLFIWSIAGASILSLDVSGLAQSVLGGAVFVLGFGGGAVAARLAAAASLTGRGAEEEIDRRERSEETREAIEAARSRGDFSRWEGMRSND
jgi:hypothetical protein